VSGINFVIIRAGYGNGNKDKWFDENYRKAKAAGLHIGAYWYSYATSADGAKQEAQSCAKVLSGKQLDYPVYFDIEEKSQLSAGRISAHRSSRRSARNSNGSAITQDSTPRFQA
jgi:lysozyme